MNNIIDIKKYSPLSSDQFFFDNNVWMYLYCPIGNYKNKKQKNYSNFFNSILTNRSTIIVNSLVLSEFSNACLRLDFEFWKKDEKRFNVDYKHDYLSSERYRKTIPSIISSLKSILKSSEKMPDNLNFIKMDLVFNHFEKIDFNDSYYIEFCKVNSPQLKLVTDDRDFELNNFNERITILRDL